MVENIQFGEVSFLSVSNQTNHYQVHMYDDGASIVHLLQF